MFKHNDRKIIEKEQGKERKKYRLKLTTLQFKKISTSDGIVNCQNCLLELPQRQ